MRKILLIGGCGFIGHNLAIFQKKKKFNVSIVDHLKINNIKTLKQDLSDNSKINLYKKIINERIYLLKKNKIKLYKFDANNYLKLKNIYNKIKPDIIIQLAAISHANRVQKAPKKAFDTSVSTLVNALELCKSKKTKIIYFSSSMVYGNFKSSKVNEKTQCNPISIYGLFKFQCEQIIQIYSKYFDIPFTIVRPSALYGERCISNRVGQIFLENSLQNKPLIIKGSGYERLDFTYIKDFTNGIYKIILNPIKSKNQIFNITFGNSKTINDLLKIVKSKVNNLEYRHIKKDNFTPSRGTLSISKARRLLKYSPAYDLKKGFNNYISWYKKILKK